MLLSTSAMTLRNLTLEPCLLTAEGAPVERASSVSGLRAKRLCSTCSHETAW